MTQVTKILIENKEATKKYDIERGKLDKQILEIAKRKAVIARRISKLMKFRVELINRVKPEELKEYQQLYGNK